MASDDRLVEVSEDLPLGHPLIFEEAHRADGAIRSPDVIGARMYSSCVRLRALERRLADRVRAGG